MRYAGTLFHMKVSTTYKAICTNVGDVFIRCLLFYSMLVYDLQKGMLAPSCLSRALRKLTSTKRDGTLVNRLVSDSTDNGLAQQWDLSK